MRGNDPVATSDYAPDQEAGHRIIPSDPQLQPARFKLHIEDIWVEAGVRIRWKITNANCIKLWRSEEHGLLEVPNGSVLNLWADQGDGEADPSFGSPLDLWIEGIAEGWGTIRVEMILPNVDKVVAYDEIRFTVYDFDLDIDSLNRGEYEGPDHSPEEDAAEESEGLFNWKRLAINNGDADDDGLPGYMDWQEADNHFVPFTLKIPDPMQGKERNPFASEKVYIRFSYGASNPALLDVNAQPVVLPPGHLRIWKKDADEARDVVDDFIQPGEWYAWDELAGDDVDGFEITLYVEAVRVFGLRTIQTELLYTEDNEDFDSGLYFLNPFDFVCLTTIAPLDLAIDSLNTGRFNGPQLTPEEDAIENKNSLPGKVIITSQGDVNGNGIPDFADGIGKFPNAAAAGAEDFIPIRLTLPTELDASRLRIRFAYNASDPANVSYDEGTGKYTPASGQLRVWTKQGTEPRNYGDVGAEVPGNYVKPEVYYAWPQLNPDHTEERSVTLYVEAVRPGDAVGGDKISAEAYYLDDTEIPRRLNEDIVQCTLTHVAFGGTLVYDPKLEGAGEMSLHTEIAIPRNVDWAMSGRLALYSVADDVVCFLEKNQAMPKGRLNCPWDGKYGTKTADSRRGTPGHPDHIGKYADPGTYTLRFDIFLPDGGVPFHRIELPVMLVRLGPANIDFADAQPYKFHSKKPKYKAGTGTTAITVTSDPTDHHVDAYWKIRNLDFKKMADLNSVARLAVSPKGEAFNNESNHPTPDPAKPGEKYIDADGNDAYTPGDIQVNFPRLVFNGTTFVEDTEEFNYPAVYVMGSKPTITFTMGQGLSDIQVAGTAPNQTASVVPPGYSNTSRYPIRVVPMFRGKKMKSQPATPANPAGNDLTPTLPAGATYTFKADEVLENKVGSSEETIAFNFQYNRTGERFVDANDNGKYDAGETVVNDHNGNGEYDEDWQDIPGEYKTTHHIYRLAAAPTVESKRLCGIYNPATGSITSERIYLKIVDFTCIWADSETTTEGVFQKIWSSKFWTPIIGTGAGKRPDNPHGFHGNNDPSENLRYDMWGAMSSTDVYTPKPTATTENKPKSYTYQHNMTGDYGRVSWMLDNNQGRCEAWGAFLRVFIGIHGGNSKRQVMPAMKWRLVDGAGNTLRFTSTADARRCHIGHWRTAPDPTATPPVIGEPAQLGDKWYEPFGIWVESDGQANPFYPSTPHLLSFFVDMRHLGYIGVDHVFVKYNGHYYDPSYEHGTTGNITVNAMIDVAKIDFFYTNRKTSDGVRFIDDLLPLTEIHMGPDGTRTHRAIRFPNIRGQNEVEEP